MASPSVTQKGLPASGWHAGWPWERDEETVHTDGHVGESMRQRPHDWPASHDEIGGADGGVIGGESGGAGGGGGPGGGAGAAGGGGEMVAYAMVYSEKEPQFMRRWSRPQVVPVALHTVPGGVDWPQTGVVAVYTRGPQSPQSLPRPAYEYSEPGPPSSQTR